MNRMSTFFIVAIIGTLSLNIQAKEPDWASYNKLLSQHVSKGKREGVKLMMVDYEGIRKNPLYGEVVKLFENFDPAQLSNKEEKLAFYINAYNILAIKMVLDHWPVKSINDAGSLFSSVWKKDVGKINHKVVTLNEVEHKILRKMGEPRIHMAIVCASISCPDLRNEPYTSEKLSKQLDDQSKRFVNNPGKGLRLRGNTAEVSKIFDWFEEDFDTVGGVASFIRTYRKNLPGKLDIDADIDYNWNLNSNQ